MGGGYTTATDPISELTTNKEAIPMSKNMKLLGLAVLLALAITAFAGVTAATAKICSGSGTGEPCAGSHGRVFSGTIAGSSTNASIVSSWNTMSCKQSTFHGSVTKGGIVAAILHLAQMRHEGCTDSFGQNCTASTTASEANKWPGTATTGTAPNGTITIENVTVNFTCGSTPCNYFTAKAGASGEMFVSGGAPATLTVTKVPLSKEPGSGALCSSTGTWSGTYTINVPSSLYLT